VASSTSTPQQAARVEERDLAGEPGARRGVDQLGAAILEATSAPPTSASRSRDGGGLAVPREEAPDARGRVERLEQLDSVSPPAATPPHACSAIVFSLSAASRARRDRTRRRRRDPDETPT